MPVVGGESKPLSAPTCIILNCDVRARAQELFCHLAALLFSFHGSRRKSSLQHLRAPRRHGA